MYSRSIPLKTDCKRGRGVQLAKKGGIYDPFRQICQHTLPFSISYAMDWPHVFLIMTRIFLTFCGRRLSKRVSRETDMTRKPTTFCLSLRRLLYTGKTELTQIWSPLSCSWANSATTVEKGVNTVSESSHTVHESSFTSGRLRYVRAFHSYLPNQHLLQ